jgi:hypothetical protein
MNVEYKGESREVVGELSPKQLAILFRSPSATPETKKLFDGRYDTVKISVHTNMAKKQQEVAVVFQEKDKPGFLYKTFTPHFIRLVQQDWINSPVLNRSGLASLLWNDLKQNNLRRRLEQRAYYLTFQPEEKRKIVEELEKLLHLVKKSLEI